MPKIKVIKLVKDAILPSRSTNGSAAVDLRGVLYEPLTIPKGECRIIHTGLCIYIEDPNYAGIILPRSGLATNRGIVLKNTIGLIDSDYQGECLIPLWNNSDSDFTIHPKERIAQLAIIPILNFEFEEVDVFSASGRGIGGFGHTGV